MTKPTPTAASASSGATPSEADKLCIDLCCGRKGFSRAFVEAGWEVVTVDIDPKFEPTLMADITKLDDAVIWNLTQHSRPYYQKVVVLFSPPCERFSKANGRAWLKGAGDALRVVAAGLDLIDAIQPSSFCMENPTGRLRWFIRKPLSRVRLKNYGYPTGKPTDLWHDIPNFKMLESDAKGDGGRHEAPFRRGNMQTPKSDQWSDRLSAAERATMPLGLSKAILEAVEQP